MTPELTLLSWTLVLELVQIMLPATLRTRETGTAYNIAPRDAPGPPVGALTGRLQRALTNLFETLPLFIAALLIAHVADKNGALTLWGARLFLLGRVLYVPLYALGVAGVRTVAWMIATAGLALVLVAVLA
jgi:uncharacterized MAPEG superfamily protein